MTWSGLRQRNAICLWKWKQRGVMYRWCRNWFVMLQSVPHKLKNCISISEESKKAFSRETAPCSLDHIPTFKRFSHILWRRKPHNAFIFGFPCRILMYNTSTFWIICVECWVKNVSAKNSVVFFRVAGYFRNLKFYVHVDVGLLDYNAVWTCK